jgi:hypothetical protein
MRITCCLTSAWRGVAVLFLALLALVNVTCSLKAASIYGSDDFSTGISATRWPINDSNHGTITVAGNSGHASFLVPGASTAEQNAYLVWAGRPRADADWSAEVRGHNIAPASVFGGSSLQLGVGEARLGRLSESQQPGRPMQSMRSRPSMREATTWW